MKKAILAVSIFTIGYLMTACTEPTACFEFKSNSIDDDGTAKVGEKITFVNCSENAKTYSWNFGDDDDSNSSSPTHSYSKGGTYSVILEAEDNGKTNELTQEITILSMDGEWEGTFNIGDTDFDFIFEIEQENEELEGSFVFTDGSGESQFTSADVDDNEVTIKFVMTFDDGTSGTFKFVGEVNDNYDQMEGIYYFDNEEMGEWSAEGNTNKSVVTVGEPNIAGKEKMIEKIKKSLK